MSARPATPVSTVMAGAPRRPPGPPPRPPAPATGAAAVSSGPYRYQTPAPRATARERMSATLRIKVVDLGVPGSVPAAGSHSDDAIVFRHRVQIGNQPAELGQPGRGQRVQLLNHFEVGREPHLVPRLGGVG